MADVRIRPAGSSRFYIRYLNQVLIRVIRVQNPAFAGLGYFRAIKNGAPGPRNMKSCASGMPA